MNYFGARQRLSDKRWDYTCMNDGQVWPVGYCKVWKPMTADDVKTLGSPDQVASMVREHEEKYGPLKENYHAGGHETAAEAEACYRKYLLDTRSGFSEKQDENNKKRCAICKEWTQHSGWVDNQDWPLCPPHQTRDSLEKLFGSIGQIWSS